MFFIVDFEDLCNRCLIYLLCFILQLLEMENYYFLVALIGKPSLPTTSGALLGVTSRCRHFVVFINKFKLIQRTNLAEWD